MSAALNIPSLDLLSGSTDGLKACLHSHLERHEGLFCLWIAIRQRHVICHRAHYWVRRPFKPIDWTISSRLYSMLRIWLGDSGPGLTCPRHSGAHWLLLRLIFSNKGCQNFHYFDAFSQYVFQISTITVVWIISSILKEWSVKEEKSSVKQLLV